MIKPKYAISFFLVLLPVLYGGNANAQDDDLSTQFVEIKIDSLHNNTSALLSDYFIGKYEVSVADYQLFLNAMGQTLPDPPPDYRWDDKDLPMVIVSYDEAQSYCYWFSDVYQIQFRLPTADEWTLAAGKSQENIANKTPTPICTNCMPPNDNGIYGMNGNVWEWTSTLKDEQFNIILGGSYEENPDSLNVIKTYALSPGLQIADVGFRVATDAKEMKKYFFAQKIKDLLHRLLPEFTNITVEPHAIYIDEFEIPWSSTYHPLVRIDEKELTFSFCCVNPATDDTEMKGRLALPFYYNKNEITLVRQLANHINNREITLFKD